VAFRYLISFLTVVMTFSVTAPAASAQTTDREPGPSSFLVDLTKDIVFDPTTWAPASISFGATRLDWNSSQVFFRQGILERNPRFTVNGLSPGVPIGYGDGNRKILGDTLAILQMSVINNVSANLVERVLLKHHPERRKLLRTLGWVERIAFASYWSHRLSAAHFEQWRTNERLAREYGYK
jgi:hypothetical protein